MLSKFNNKKHRRLTALLLCVALMLGSVTSVSADISAADSETEVQSGAQTYTEEPTAEAVSYEAPVFCQALFPKKSVRIPCF